MNDEVFIRICGVFYNYSSKSLKQIAGVDSDKSINADIANICFIAIQGISDETVFLDFLATWTVVELFTDFNANQAPFPSCRVKILGFR